MKLIVCEECDAEFRIKHGMDEHHYQITHCPFCGESAYDPEFVDEIEWDGDEEFLYYWNKERSWSST